MVVKLTDESLVKAIGATGANDFQEKLSAYIATSQTATKFMADSQASLDSIAKQITDLKASIPSEDRIKAIVTEQISGATTKAISDWAASESGKKIIGGEASRITMEALGSVGTQPAKPSPAPAAGVDTPEQKSSALTKEGKYEEAFKADANIRAEFFTAKAYAAYCRAERRGAIQVKTSVQEMGNFKQN